MTLHSLRHSHASALIAAGTDAATVSRRLGHGKPDGDPWRLCESLFDRGDAAAAEVIEDVLGGRKTDR